MSVQYSYTVVAPEAGDLLLGTEISSAGEITPRTRSFTIGSIIALASVAPIYTNSTTLALPLSTLNAAYPGAVIGTRVHCISITAGAIRYEKTLTGWISNQVTIVT